MVVPPTTDLTFPVLWAKTLRCMVLVLVFLASYVAVRVAESLLSVPLLGSYDFFGGRLFLGASRSRTASGSTSTQTSLQVVPSAEPPVVALSFALWDPLRSALVWTCLIGSVGWQSCISARWGLPSLSNQRPADALAKRLQTPGRPPQALTHPVRDRCPKANTVRATWTASTRLPLQAATPLLSSHTKPQLGLYWLGLIVFKLGLFIKVNVNTGQNKCEVQI